MVEKIKAWHEEFIQGVNWKMLGLAAAGLISASFFVRGKFDDIVSGQTNISHKVDTISVRFNSRLYEIKNDINRRMDVKFDTLQHEIEKLSDKVNANTHSNNLRPRVIYVTETKKGKEIITHPYNPYTNN